MPRLGFYLACAGAAAIVSGCGALAMKQPEQGIAGTFTTYGPPPQPADCSPLKTQFQKDSCRRENERVVEMPYQGVLLIRNLDSRKTLSQPLDERGTYRAVLNPGNYEICVNGECSDPIEVRRSGFATYGQRLPRAAPEGKPAPGKGSAEAGATVKTP
jgi:hypothetical protein